MGVESVITEIFTALSNAILAFINNVINFITSPLTDYINSVVTQYPANGGYCVTTEFI